MEATFGARAATQRGTDADVVICVSPALIGSAMVLARLRMAWHRPALGLWVQDLYSRGVVEAAQASHVMAEAARVYEGTVAHLADGVAVVHDRFANYVSLRLYLSPDRVTVIRNWTHLRDAVPADRVETRRRLGWAHDEVIALHAGNMGAKQGLENLVDAARLAEETGRRVTVVLLGGGNQQAALKQRAEGLQNIRFLASLPGRDFQDALAAADVLLVNERPGVLEMSVPSKLTSYYTSGRPVLAATGAGTVTAHEIELSGAGIRVDPGSPAALLAGVDRLVSSPVLSAELVRNAGRFLSEVLSEEAALDQFELWMDKLISRRAEKDSRS
ncbi:hypothetical protein BH10ACT10_BH10ACT10_01770 [soil metagenome]